MGMIEVYDLDGSRRGEPPRPQNPDPGRVRHGRVYTPTAVAGTFRS